MNLTVICFFVSLIAVSLTLSPDEKYTKVFTAIWKELDADADGALSLEEVENGLVSDYDTNHGGSVSLEEFLAAFGQQQKAAKEIFKQIDSNKDDVWTRTDFTLLIKSIDANGDDKVIQSEFVSVGMKLFKAVNFDPDGLMIVG